MKKYTAILLLAALFAGNYSKKICAMESGSGSETESSDSYLEISKTVQPQKNAEEPSFSDLSKKNDPDYGNIPEIEPSKGATMPSGPYQGIPLPEETQISSYNPDYGNIPETESPNEATMPSNPYQEMPLPEEIKIPSYNPDYGNIPETESPNEATMPSGPYQKMPLPEETQTPSYNPDYGNIPETESPNEATMLSGPYQKTPSVEACEHDPKTVPQVVQQIKTPPSTPVLKQKRASYSGEEIKKKLRKNLRSASKIASEKKEKLKKASLKIRGGKKISEKKKENFTIFNATPYYITITISLTIDQKPVITMEKQLIEPKKSFTPPLHALQKFPQEIQLEVYTDEWHGILKLEIQSAKAIIKIKNIDEKFAFKVIN